MNKYFKNQFLLILFNILNTIENNTKSKICFLLLDLRLF